MYNVFMFTTKSGYIPTCLQLRGRTVRRGRQANLVYVVVSMEETDYQ